MSDSSRKPGWLTIYAITAVVIILWGLSYIWSDRLLALDIPVEFIVPVRIFIAGLILLGLNLVLVAPVTLMSRFQRPVGIGLIPAIATAAYATWKITMALVNFRRRRGIRDLVIRQMRTINLIDALVSVLTLQNTLIMVNTKDGGAGMLTLTAVTSAAIMLTVLSLSAAAMIKGIAGRKNGG